MYVFYIFNCILTYRFWKIFPFYAMTTRNQERAATVLVRDEFTGSSLTDSFRLESVETNDQVVRVARMSEGFTECV